MDDFVNIKKILLVFGTRPEAIKMARVYKELVEVFGINNVKVCVSGQHREMLDQVLELFEIVPDYDLKVMEVDQTLVGVTAKVLYGVTQVLSLWKPDIVLVQGDTTTCMAAALAAFYHHIPVGHIEAGLRTGNIMAPWPEEMNRKLVSELASIHFAPTQIAKFHLIAENIPEKNIIITGNTVVDALQSVVGKIKCSKKIINQLKVQFKYLDFQKRIILVTGHRRENFGPGFEQICQAILQISQNNNVDIVYPVHLNPNVQKTVKLILSSQNNIHLIGPLDYLPFVYLMNSAYIILTDSGGVQEEGPALGKPVLVMRKSTERPEGVQAGTVRLVGTDKNFICREVNRLLNDEDFYFSMAGVHNPYGDGRASSRICAALRGEYVDEFVQSK